MEGEGTTPEGLRPLPSTGAPEPEPPLPLVNLPGASLVRRPILTADGDTAPPIGAASLDIGRIPHPQGRPVVIELPTDPAVLTTESLQALSDAAADLPGVAAGQKKSRARWPG